MFSNILIFIHVAAAILLLGPVTVAVSAFPRQAANAKLGDAKAAATAAFHHRITNGYGLLSLAVPLVGAIIMFLDFDAYRTQWQFHTALLLSVIAWVVLLAMVIPQQRKMMGSLGALDPAEADPEKDYTANFEKSKKMATIGGGIFNLLWIIMLVLMIF